MDSKGALSISPVRQSRRVAILAGAVAGRDPGAGVLVGHHRDAASRERIAELAQLAGVPQAEAIAELARTHRMLLWEGGTFLLLLLTVSGALFWYYRRDMRRARGTQAFFAALDA